jgi:hypothetical protein
LERFRFGSDVAFAPREELLDGVTVAPLSGSIFQGSPFQAAVFRVAPGGRIARHPATYPQVLAVLDGSGNVSGPSGVEEPIEAGEAVFWQRDLGEAGRAAPKPFLDPQRPIRQPGFRPVRARGGPLGSSRRHAS